MYRQYATAPVKSLPDFRFTEVRVLTFGSGIIKTHGWVHVPSGVDAGGFDKKADAIKSAREYRNAWKKEQEAR